jgi:hypothetical protein
MKTLLLTLLFSLSGFAAGFVGMDCHTDEGSKYLYRSLGNQLVIAYDGTNLDLVINPSEVDIVTGGNLKIVRIASLDFGVTYEIRFRGNQYGTGVIYDSLLDGGESPATCALR